MTYVGVVLKVVADREVDPLSPVDHGGAIKSRVGNNVELILGADTAAHQELRATESTSRDDNTTSHGSELDGALVSALEVRLDLNTGDVTA